MSRPTELLDALDSLVEEYLAVLDSYQALQSQLQRDLQAGHLDLARAKLALGPDRLSQRNYDLSERSPCLKVNYNSLVAPVQSESESSARVEWSTAPARSPPVSSPVAQFSALPPAALKSAALAFERCVTRGVVRIVETERELGRLEREITRVREEEEGIPHVGDGE
ncbi:hypothetical protein JCM11491_007096 [Sporobolomyces phaffii]